MSQSKDKIKGIIGTIVLHLVLFIALIFMALKTPLPLPDEEGVVVDLGWSDVGSGYIQKEEPPPAILPEKVEVTPPPEQEEQIITSESEETPVIEEIIENKPQEEVEDPPIEKVIEEVVEEEPEPEPEPEPVVNPNALYQGNQSKSSEGGNEGITGDPGDQGKPTGTPDVKKYDGIGGLGDDGISYDLGGRGASSLPKPVYSSEEQGKIVVTIWVDRAGKVTRAEPGAKGTTISDINQSNLTKQAALKARFAPDPAAPETQKGTITYIFIKMN